MESNAFDVQREWDGAAQKNVDDAFEKLDECQDKKDDRDQRLIRLDDLHYFDPVHKQVLVRDAGAGGYAALELPLDSAGAAASPGAGTFTPVEGGLFWHAETKRLYVKNDDVYVPFTPDFCEPTDAR